MKGLTDEEIIQLLQLAFDRFTGYTPEERLLINCLSDFRTGISRSSLPESKATTNFSGRS